MKKPTTYITKSFLSVNINFNIKHISDEDCSEIEMMKTMSNLLENALLGSMRHHSIFSYPP